MADRNRRESAAIAGDAEKQQRQSLVGATPAPTNSSQESVTAPTKRSMDELCINTIRTLSMDAVQRANSGHPGTPMALAPVAYTLWQRFLRFDPEDPIWPNRDRFVLSNGHASMLLYAMLHLTGVKAVNAEYERLGELSVTLDDIKRFREIAEGAAMPVYALGVAENHVGPGEHYFEMLRLSEVSEVPSDAELAEDLLRGLVRSGFDVARMGRIEYGNNLMVPLHLIRPEMDIPIIPVFINVFTPPLASVARTYELGQRVRQLLAQRDGRIGFIATGGLSHWPPIWNEKSPADDAFLARMKRFQTEGRSVLLEDPGLLTDLGKYEVEMAAKGDQRLVNEEWDREFLRLLEAGNVEAVTSMSYDEVENDAGLAGTRCSTGSR